MWILTLQKWIKMDVDIDLCTNQLICLWSQLQRKGLKQSDGDSGMRFAQDQWDLISLNDVSKRKIV